MNRSEKIKLKHDSYRNIHDGVLKSVSSLCPTIISKQNKLYTTCIEKHALVKMDRKRFWLDRENSVGYGHPIIESFNIEKPEAELVNVNPQGVPWGHIDPSTP